MSTPWQEAHERLLSSLTVHTHRQPERRVDSGAPEGRGSCLEQVRRLRKLGRSRKQIAAVLRISVQAVGKHWRAIDAEES